MELRKYRPQDCAEITRLFYDTVHTVNAADYTEEQLDAWADGQVDLENGTLRFWSMIPWWPWKEKPLWASGTWTAPDKHAI